MVKKQYLRVRFPMGLEKHACNGNEFPIKGLERQLNIRVRRGRASTLVLRGRLGTYGTGMGALGRAWARLGALVRR